MATDQSNFTVPQGLAHAGAGGASPFLRASGVGFQARTAPPCSFRHPAPGSDAYWCRRFPGSFEPTEDEQHAKQENHEKDDNPSGHHRK